MAAAAVAGSGASCLCEVGTESACDPNGLEPNSVLGGSNNQDDNSNGMDDDSGNHDGMDYPNDDNSGDDNSGGNGSDDMGTTGGDAAVGMSLYQNRCASCHRLGSVDTSGFAGSLSAKGDDLVADLGTLDSSMSGLMLTAQEMADLAAYLDAN